MSQISTNESRKYKRFKGKVDTLNRQVAQKQNEISASNQYITKINAEIEKLKSESQSDDSAKLNKELKVLKGHNTEKESLIDKRSYYDIAQYCYKIVVSKLKS